MTEFAKDAPPEMMPKFIKTCKWQAANNGKCQNQCRLCPGYYVYNNGAHCITNGWTDVALGNRPDPKLVSNATAFIEHHTPPKPARKKPQPVVMPNHLDVEIDLAEGRVIRQQNKVSSLAEQLNRERQTLRLIKAAHRATVAQAKKEARK